MNNTPNNGASEDPEMRERMEQLLERSPAYQHLDSDKRHDLAQALSKVTSFLAGSGGSPSLARQMAPDLSQLRPGQAQVPTGSTPPASQVGAAQPAPAAAGGGGGAVGRVGEVARATLSAIDFPSFVASLIQGTFQAIVDSSIQQMEAYAELLKNVAGTVDRFMSDNISDGTARDYLADQYGGLLARDTTGGQPRLRVETSRKSSEEVPSFFKELGFDSPEQIDDDSIEQVIVPATRRFLAESRQRTLATMVLMGINRVVVDDGEITAKLQFHIDATEAMQMRFDQTKTTAGNMSGHAGRNPFGAQAVMVNTASLNAQSDVNVRADLTGQVRVKFRSETFPLERFADSAAIQLINSHARVPQAAPAPGAGGATAPAAMPIPAAKPAGTSASIAPVAASGPVAPGTGAQSLEARDLWAPEVS